MERIESKGLAHYSYLLGDMQEALVIDPRRDCRIYVDKAMEEGMRIKYVLETHRNEDYVVGSTELSSRTGAEVWHADVHLDYKYGSPAREGQTWRLGRLSVQALSTPGHTRGCMSYLLRDAAGKPWMVFTGDALFAGDVGRVDLEGMDRALENARLLEKSIFDLLLPLGDEVILCPAHGAGSVCGTAISDRPWSTLGMERRHNPRLDGGREGFAARIAAELERPPYFRQMEVVNLQGSVPLSSLPPLKPLSALEFAFQAKEHVVLDVRSETGYAAAHVPGSQFIWMDGLAGFAGWILSYDRPLLLVTDGLDPRAVVQILQRIGYDSVDGYLAGGMLSWHMAGLESESIETVTVQQLCRDLDKGAKPFILDVRKEEELKKSGSIPDALNIPLTSLAGSMNRVPKEGQVYIFCGSGMRSMVAASLARSRGWRNTTVVLGGLAGWKSVTCPLQR